MGVVMQAAFLPPGSSQPIEWAFRTHTLEGESECGDAHVVATMPQGVLAAVVDGLGHGCEAAAAARIAVETLEARRGLAVIDLMTICHEALRKTRGAVLSLAFFNTADDTMTWLGVGNVEGILLRANPSQHPQKESLLLRSGVVGYQMASLRAATLPLFFGDMLIFVTDGIDARFNDDLWLTQDQDPEAIAADILSQHLKGTDDALVLVIRYLGMKA